MPALRPEIRSAITRAVPAAIVQPSVPWPVARKRLADRRRADDRRAVGRHRPQAAPELGARDVAAAREEIVDDMRERAAGAPRAGCSV